MMSDLPPSLLDVEYRIERFFEPHPGTLEIYRTLETILFAHEGVTRDLLKTQIAFSHGKRMAFVWFPIRKMKVRPKVYVLLTLCLGRRADHPALAEVVEPYPGRWTNHFVISGEDDIDRSLLEYIDEAWRFAAR